MNWQPFMNSVYMLDLSAHLSVPTVILPYRAGDLCFKLLAILKITKIKTKSSLGGLPVAQMVRMFPSSPSPLQ